MYICSHPIRVGTGDSMDRADAITGRSSRNVNGTRADIRSLLFLGSSNRVRREAFSIHSGDGREQCAVEKDEDSLFCPPPWIREQRYVYRTLQRRPIVKSEG